MTSSMDCAIRPRRAGRRRSRNRSKERRWYCSRSRPAHLVSSWKSTRNFGGETFHQWPALKAAIPRAHLYRAFNSLGWDVFAEPVIGGIQADLFYAGPEGASKHAVERLIEDVGLRPIWVGDSDHAETVDGVLRLWYTLSRTHGRHIAFKLITD